MYYLFKCYLGCGYNLIDVSDNLNYLIHKRKELKRKNPNVQYTILRDIYWRLQ